MLLIVIILFIDFNLLLFKFITFDDLANLNGGPSKNAT
jgi:hypothetical protein